MLIRLDARSTEPVHWVETLHLAPFDQDEALKGLKLGSVEVVGDLTRVGSEWRLGASLRYRRQLPCDRCLDPVVEEVDSKFQWILRRSAAVPVLGSDAMVEKPVPVEVEEGCLQVAGEWLDTETLVREQVLLDLPARTLCQESCRGLCPVCGAHYDREGCHCGPVAPDPRWGALAAVRVALQPGRSGTPAEND